MYCFDLDTVLEVLLAHFLSKDTNDKEGQGLI